MRKIRFITLFLVLAGLVGLSSLVVSCGGSGGGGGGVAVDNTKANGTFSYVAIDGAAGFTADRGTLTFDGAGHGVFTSLAGGGSGTFNYTVTVPGNTLTVAGTTIGTINSAGNFLTAAEITAGGSLFLMSAVKTAPTSTYTDTLVNFVGGEFADNAGSQVMLFTMTTATPAAGNLFFNDLTSTTSGTAAYTIATNGTFTVTDAGTPFLNGAVSGDKNIMIWADTETGVSLETGVAVALKLPGSGMSNASLNGTYSGFEFYDSTGTGLGITRFTLTFNGAGSGSYTVTLDSQGDTGTFPFTYTMAADGTFVIDVDPDPVAVELIPGVALQDGSVVSFGDDTADGYISTGIAIKR